jgi:hypothetical protein
VGATVAGGLVGATVGATVGTVVGTGVAAGWQAAKSIITSSANVITRNPFIFKSSGFCIVSAF